MMGRMFVGSMANGAKPVSSYFLRCPMIRSRLILGRDVLVEQLSSARGSRTCVSPSLDVAIRGMGVVHQLASSHRRLSVTILETGRRLDDGPWDGSDQ